MKQDLILIVEDDVQISKFIAYALEQAGYASRSAPNAESALAQILTNKFALVLLDLGLPDKDGMAVLRCLREWATLPIIVVSARDQDKDKVLALDAGADDYLSKPFSAAELLARIRVALRHSQQITQAALPARLQVAELSLDFSKRLAYLGKTELHLTPLEYSLLALLFKNMGKVLTSKFIISEIYGKAYGTDTQALRTLMAGLRRKIESDPARPRYIYTEIGVGYRLVDE